MRQPSIEEFGLISDRNTCAIVDRAGTIGWYCPTRFDGDAVLSSILDADLGGYWSITSADKTFLNRDYVDNGGALETRFAIEGRGFTIKDWLPQVGPLQGLCRVFSPAPRTVTSTVRLRAGYGVSSVGIRQVSAQVVESTEPKLWFSASHPLRQIDDTWVFDIPPGESAWAILTTVAARHDNLTSADFCVSSERNASAWKALASASTYEGPYQRQVHESTRVVQQLTYERTGGVLAAATTSLPEVLGGSRNYDYRYVWTRDISLIVSALAQVDGVSRDARRALEFIVGAFELEGGAAPSPFYAVDQSVVTEAHKPNLGGYFQSCPVQIGNAAADQLQLDAIANVLLAAKMLYDQEPQRVKWSAMQKIADYLASNWRLDDHGIWEENVERAYTSSKVFAARGLEFMADFSDDPDQTTRWNEAARQIREFVAAHCMTKSGAFAVYAGSQEVDVTACLFALWSYVDPDDSAMLATIEAIEQHFSRGSLYWRRLEEFDSSREGAFLAASCWMAHYYAVAGDVSRSRDILDAVLQHQKDLGLFAEEGGAADGQRMLGNFPQTFVHSSFICAVNGLKSALAGRDSRVK